MPTGAVAKMPKEGLSRYQWILWLTGLVFLAVIGGALWQWTGLSEYLHPIALFRRFAFVRESWWAIPITWGLILIASFAIIPINLQFLVVGTLFDYYYAIPLSLSGALLAAYALYSVGSRIDIHRALENAPESIKSLQRNNLEKMDLLEMTLLKFLPLGPFTTMNLFLGAAHVPRGNFLFATAMGLLPGAIFMSFVGHGLRTGAAGWSRESLFWISLGIIGVLVLSIIGKYYAKRVLKDV